MNKKNNINEIINLISIIIQSHLRNEEINSKEDVN
ncbi:Uncharacterised protein [uncultured Clostridium sp.]|nr:Uncharacterised protein [uncultured Clostridium sp.]